MSHTMELSEFNNANQTVSQMNIDPAHLYRNHQLQGVRYVNNGNQQQQQLSSPPLATSATVTNQIKQKHRELPVDVPDSFVGIAKQSPRYPPPKPHRQVSPMNNNTNNNSTIQYTTSTTNNNNNNNNLTTNNTSCAQQTLQQNHPPANNNIISSSSSSANTAANLLNHNSSGLRSSIKLQQLEKARNNGQQFPVGSMQPAINQAFELNEDDAANIQQTTFATNNQINDHRQLYQQQQALKLKQKQQQQLEQPDLSFIYNRLQNNLGREFADISGEAKLSKLLSIYNTIVQTHNKQFTIPNLKSRHSTIINAQGQQEQLTYKVSDLLQSVISLFNNDEEMTNDAAELLSILCKHEMDGVCSAFDRIAQSFEFAKSTNSGSTSPTTSSTDMIIDNNNQSLSHPHQQQQQYSSAHMYPPPHKRPLSNQMNNNTQAYYNQQQLYNQQYNNHHQAYQMGQGQIQMDIENNLFQYNNNSNLHPLTDIDHGDGTCTKIVRIEKMAQQALGATIKNIDGSIVIGRLVGGGAAYMSGLLNEGDEVIEINDIPMRGKSINEVVDEIDALQGVLTFKIISRYNNYNNGMNTNMNNKIQEKVFVRAFFSYDGENDNFMPCKELALSFKKGEILTIIDQSDPQWWQAHREGAPEMQLAGLIPSINFLKQKERNLIQDGDNHLNHVIDDDETIFMKHHEKKACFVTKLFNCPKGTSPRRRKKPPNIPFGPEEIPYYEEVSLYYPIKYQNRPIILVGPKMIGQIEIRLKLLQDSNRFTTAISHTSKPMQEHERNGVDFHFVSRAQFEANIKADKFIEFGLYQNQYYGTSLEAMKEVVNSKKTCIHLLNTTSIFNFRHSRAGSELKPFFVFVKPDDSHPEKLRNLVSQFSPQKSNIEENIKAIIAEVQMIEAHYLPYFDLVIEVSDVERAYQKLLLEIDKVEKEPQWIPSFWLETPPS